MRAALAALAAAATMFLLAGCSDVQQSANEAASSAASIGSGIRSSAASIGSGVRSSAASIGAGLRSACQAGDSSMRTLDDLAGRLAEDAGQRQALLPEVRSTVDQLAAAVDDRAELQPVVAAGRALVKAMGDASEATVEAAARQTQVAVGSGQALCKVAK